MRAWMLLIAACSGPATDEVTGTPTPAPDTATSTTPDTGTGTTVEETCPWAGEWDVTELLCDGAPVDFRADDPERAITLTIDHSAGGCEIEVFLYRPECGERELLEMPDADSSAPTDITSDGVWWCSVDGCEFAVADDSPCQVGDRAGTHRVQVADEVLLAIESATLWQPAYPYCAGIMTARATFVP